MDKIAIKERLIEICRIKIQERIDLLKASMNAAQHEANQHIGAMQSRYDTFKEEAQALRDGFARQVDEATQNLKLIKQLSPKLVDSVQLGAIVETSEMNYFISINILDKPISIDGKEYFPISLNSPICQVLIKKSEYNEAINFRGRKFTISQYY